jgi:hypothetical protein
MVGPDGSFLAREILAGCYKQRILAARPHEQPPDVLQVLRVRHKGVCSTKDPLRESLIDGSEKTQPIIKIKSTAKDLERQQRFMGAIQC